MKYQLFRVYGDVEPTLLGATARNRRELRRLVVQHLKAEPYDDKDGLFVLITNRHGLQSMDSFSGGEMDKLRALAEP